MSDKTDKWMAEVMASPEYAAATIAHDLIFDFEKRREELGLSYADLARRMGVSRQRIYSLMTGNQNATISSLVKLAMALECDLKIDISTKVQQPRKSKPAKDALEKMKSAEKPKPSRKRRKPVKPDERRVG